MIGITHTVLLLIGICVYFTSNARPQIEDPFSLSLEELNMLKVSVTSNYQQSVRTSPGIVRVIDKHSIKKNGWRNLQQVLMHIPGIQISISKNGHSNIWMRGVQNRNNNKVLLLVDGVPQHDEYYGNFNINNQLPLEQVEKIEILNGPGGVVHGANSFSGVISITTRSKGRSVGGAIHQQNSYSSATNNELTYAGDIYAETDWSSESGNIYLFASNLDQEGFRPQYNRSAEHYERDTSVERQYLLVKYNYNNLDLKLDYSDYQYPYLYTKSNRWQGYSKQFFSASGRYKYKINDDLELKISGFYKNYDFSRPKEFYDDERIEESGQSLHNSAAESINATILWPISNKRHASFGIIYSRDWARDTLEESTVFPINSPSLTSRTISLTEDTSRDIIGLFSEYQQNILTDQWLHLGFRHDQLSDFTNQTSYRISLTKEIGSYYHKILFGTSYRVPSYREYLKKYNDDYEEKNPLQPEKMKTLELALGFTPNNHELLLVWYMNRYQDFIKEVSINSVDGVNISAGDGDEYSFNFDQIDITGLELSWGWSASDNLMINSSISYLIEATEDPGALTSVITSPSPISSEKTDLLFLSEFTGNIQINYQLNNKFNIYWDAVYYSDRPVPSDYQADSSIKNPDNKNSFWLSNLYIQTILKNDITLGLGINNILDSNIYSPNQDPASDYDNQWPKRQVELSIQWQY